MKLKQNIELVKLLDYGFKKIELQQEDDEDVYVFNNFEYFYDLGHSRRGQCYYLLIEGNKQFSLYASKPDGSGSSIKLGDIFNTLYENNLIE